jgi:hypothetical protein
LPPNDRADGATPSIPFTDVEPARVLDQPKGAAMFRNLRRTLTVAVLAAATVVCTAAAAFANSPTNGS